MSIDADCPRNLEGIVLFVEPKRAILNGETAEARRSAVIFHETAAALEHRKDGSARSLADYNGVCDTIAEALFLVRRPDKNCPY